jgi:hypothetical protein
MSTTTMPAQKQDHQPGVESKTRPEPDYEPKYPGVGKLKDKVALINGGDSGIGRAVAVAMAREGAKIAIIYLEEHKDANKTSELVKREGSEAILISGDVGEEKFCKSAVDKALEKFGRIGTTPPSSTRPRMFGRSKRRRSSARFAPTCSASSTWRSTRWRI